jgi:hypothetical protein
MLRLRAPLGSRWGAKAAPDALSNLWHVEIHEGFDCARQLAAAQVDEIHADAVQPISW